ncbi:MAG: type VI secretion system tip protein TssI/VgrG [Byssovorax sp.]
MSSLFSVSVWARSPNDDIDLESIVGKKAGLRTVSGIAFARHPGRTWTGVCNHMEQVHAESTGLSTYYLRIVPRLWLLTQRKNNRLFQHLSIPEIAEKMLKEWHVEHELKVHRPAYPKLELRSQYGESDFDFLNRLLEEAGISYSFHEDEKKGSVMVLHDAPHTHEPREGGPLSHVDNPSASAEQEYLTGVRLAQQVRPGKVTLRDHDFRRKPTFGFFGGKGAGHSLEDQLEQYEYAPGSFLVEVERDAVHKLGALAKEALHLPAGLGEAAGALGKVEATVHTAEATVHKAEAAAKGGAKQKIHDVVDDKVSGYVEKKVSGAVDKAVEKAVGGKLGDKLGDIAGGAAGKLAGGLAGKALGELAGKLAQSLGIVDVVGNLVGDDRGMARFSEKAGLAKAERRLEAARASRRQVTFESNAHDLKPGSVLSIGNHARSDLGADKKLLVTESSFEGTHDGEWSLSAQAGFAEVPYRPPPKTPKPSIQGLQSAVVVGSPGEEIHTDEHGRVRVQFHWDREGSHDEKSSCWMRVSQGWAGSGFGMIAIPRVGQEVLVAFLEGDPDHPVVVGRLYNATARVPYDLPAHKTRSGWKSDSSPGSGGYNELMFEDAKGRELVRVQAERDLESVVKRNEARSVGVDRRTSIGAVDESHVGVRHNVTMKQGEGEAGKTGPTFFEMVDKRIHFSTGEASITLDGPNITLAAKGRIFIHSSDDDVEILGGPWVKINCGPVKEGESDTYTMHHVSGIVRDQDGKVVPNTTVVVKGSDGAVQQVTTDGGGKYFALVPPGKCDVSLTGGLRCGVKGMNLDTMTDEAINFNDDGPAQ